MRSVLSNKGNRQRKRGEFAKAARPPYVLAKRGQPAASAAVASKEEEVDSRDPSRDHFARATRVRTTRATQRGASDVVACCATWS
jgi:hypothetical protein